MRPSPTECVVCNGATTGLYRSIPDPTPVCPDCFHSEKFGYWLIEHDRGHELTEQYREKLSKNKERLTQSAG